MAEYVSYYRDELSATTQLAVRIALERYTNMRSMTVEEFRQDQLEFSVARIIPARVHCTPEVIAGVPCEWVERRVFLDDERVIIYLHGGSWMFGGLETGRPVGVLLTDETRYRCLMVDYRLAPEHPYPAGLDDCYAVYTQLLERGIPAENIGFFGDSAGGNLSMALLNRLQSEGLPLPAAVGLASPVPDMREDSELVSSDDDLIYTRYEDEEYRIFDLYTGRQEGASLLFGLPSLSPVTANLENLCPMLIHVGTQEPLVEDNLAYAHKYHAGGGDIHLKIWEGLFHDFTVVGKTLRESRLSMDEFGSFFHQHMED